MQDGPQTPLVVHVVNSPRTLRFLTGQAAFFRDHGFLLEAVSSPGHGLAEFAGREGIPVHSVPISLGIAPFRDLVTVYRLWRLLRRLRPSIVHAHSPKAGLVGMTAAWMARVPVRIYHAHGMPRVTADPIYKRLLRGGSRVTGRLAHRVLCVSPSIRQAAVDQHHFPPEKSRVLARGTINGLDATARFNPALLSPGARQMARAGLGIPADACVLGFIGRVVRDKGVVELAEAWQDLRRRYLDLHLLVLGPSQPEDPIPTTAGAQLAGDPRVHRVDWADDTRPYYAAMDVLALPSYREGFGYVLLEAAAMMLPVVATRVPGCVDAVVDGVTGTLVPPYDARALAGAVTAYLDDPALRCAHGQAGRERVVSEFGQEEVWQALLEEYRELLASRLEAARLSMLRAAPPQPGG